jgi:lipid A 3-O-deacylase
MMATVAWRRLVPVAVGAAALGWSMISGIAPAPAEDDPSFISMFTGGYDVIGRSSHPEGTIGAEFRFGQKLWIFKPFIGALGTTQRSAYGYGGFLVDIYFGNRFVVTPHVAVGYFHQGGGTVLGAHTEFRTGGEFAYRFDDRARLGLAFHHISNAGIGQHNPGEEDATLVFSLPFNLLK